jgi:hypothetical protein
MKVSVDIEPDEHQLIQYIRKIKNIGFGEFNGTITHGEIITIYEGYTHKLKK